MKPLFLLLPVLALMLAASARAEVFASPATGFELTRPPGWEYVTAEQNAAIAGAFAISREQLDAMMKEKGIAPIVFLMAKRGPGAILDPSFKVHIQRYDADSKGRPAIEIVGAFVFLFLHSALPDVKLVQPSTDTQVSGLEAATATIAYSYPLPDGTVTQAETQLWIVPRGDWFFVLAAAYDQHENPEAIGQMQQMVKSVVIRN